MPAPLRIALVTPDYPPVPTGLGRAACEIAEALAATGADVTAFTMDRPAKSTSDSPSGNPQDRRTNGVRIIGCAELARTEKWVRRRAAFGHLIWPHAVRRAVLHAHRVRPFDVVEATNWYAPAALLTRGPWATVIRNSTPASHGFAEHPSLRDQIDNQAVRALERVTVRRADGLISNTTPHRDTICALYGPPIDVAHAVIGLALPQSLLATARQAPPPDPSEPRLLFVGRAERRKSFDEFLVAMTGPFLRSRGQRCHSPLVDFVGLATGDLEARCDALAIPAEVRHAFIDHGRADEEQLHALYARTTAVVAPSRYESYGIVYREAAAFGRPLVASATDPSARAFIHEAECGVLSDDCSPSAIAAATASVLDAPERARRYGANGRRAA
ncbi:MAG: glycosyltransferase family 4 protein, partial [Pseudomonadota bacterium]